LIDNKSFFVFEWVLSKPEIASKLDRSNLLNNDNPLELSELGEKLLSTICVSDQINAVKYILTWIFLDLQTRSAFLSSNLTIENIPWLEHVIYNLGEKATFLADFPDFSESDIQKIIETIEIVRF